MKMRYRYVLVLGILVFFFAFLTSCSNTLILDSNELCRSWTLITTTQEVNNPDDKYHVGSVMVGEARMSNAEANVDKNGIGTLLTGDSNEWDASYKNGKFEAHRTS